MRPALESQRSALICSACSVITTTTCIVESLIEAAERIPNCAVGELTFTLFRRQFQFSTTRSAGVPTYGLLLVLLVHVWFDGDALDYYGSKEPWHHHT